MFITHSKRDFMGKEFLNKVHHKKHYPRRGVYEKNLKELPINAIIKIKVIFSPPILNF